MHKETAIIIGAGPAGLTAAYELLKRTNIQPIVLEASDEIGGLTRTVKFNNNRLDIGGHRFFSKSDRVVDWWLNILPLENATDITPEKTNEIMLLRNRLSRIYFIKQFFNYPISLSFETIKKLGFWRITKILCSYIRANLFPIKPENNLEDFFINRFGRELYQTFFKSYTEKVWGVACAEISPEWGAQRIKGLSISKAIVHAIKKITGRVYKKTDITQKSTETSLIEHFMYPKYGPGQLWEKVAELVVEMGGVIHMNAKAVSVDINPNKEFTVQYNSTEASHSIQGKYLFSTMAIKDLFTAFQFTVPANIESIANNLVYRDFITIGVLVKKLNITVSDNWIYIQEPHVKIARLQIFNNWSPYMVDDPDTVFLGLEYFANEGDSLWSMADKALKELATSELVDLGFVDNQDIIDSIVIRVPKAYPAYFGSYDQFSEIKAFLSQYDNLYLLGRNGQHRYNNSDHSMLTAMVAVDNIVAGKTTKENIWQVNTEKRYHETA